MGRHHHTRRVEGFPGEIGGFGGRRGDLDTVQHLGHRDGLGGLLGHAALRIGNSDRGVVHGQGAGGGVGAPRHRPAGVVGVVGRHHHARRVEGFPVVVRCFGGRRGHGDVVQRPHGHRHRCGFLDPGPLIGNGDGLGALRHGVRGEGAVLRHVLGGVVLKGGRHHHARRVERLPDEIGGFGGLCGHGDPARDHQVHLVQQGAAHVHRLGHAFPVQLGGHGPVSDVWQFKLR